MIKYPDPISEKIVHLAAKNNAIEDCMAAVKKGFEHDVCDLKEFLAQIRALAGKQCKQITKMMKIKEALNGSA